MGEAGSLSIKYGNVFQLSRIESTNLNGSLPVSFRSFQPAIRIASSSRSLPKGNHDSSARLPFPEAKKALGKRFIIAAAGAGASMTSGEGDFSGDLSADIPEAPARTAERRGAIDEAKNWWQNWQLNAAELREKVAKLGLSAVLAYGLFDGVTYTTFFVMAFLGYEKSSGLNPTANLKALLGIVVLMWTANNVTRPFRVAGAAALAPFIDKGLKRLQQMLNLPNLAFTFMLVTATFASLCLSIVGLLILSRLGK